MPIDKIKMLGYNPRYGATILKSDYDVFTEFIFGVLQVHGEVRLIDLLDQAKSELGPHFAKDISWYLLKVKQDLVERGALKVKWQHDRMQVICRRKSNRYIKKENQAFIN